MRRVFAIILLVLLPGVAPAQEDESRIAQYLNEALSGLGREVLIEGFEGVLSSRVSMTKMTIADDQGVWLTLEDAVLDWNRLAVLRGEINIDQISAKRIEMTRLPVSEQGASPEAGSFALPELPVSVAIGQIAAEQVILGDAVMGMPVVLSLAGSVALADGEGAADLAIERLEGPQGAFNLKAAYSNTTRNLMVDLTLKEADDGITANLLNLPGEPALELSVKGDAPIDEFTAEVALSSDSQPRLTGQVSTRTTPPEGNPEGEAQPSARVIVVDISGDLAPLFAPEFRPFFGPDVALQSLVRLFPDGRVSLEGLDLRAAALKLDGNLDLAASGLPEQFSLNALLYDPENEAVLLPTSGPETRVKRATISAGFDAATGDEWVLDARVIGLSRPDITLGALELNAAGVIRGGEVPEVTAEIEALAKEVALADPALAKLVGRALDLSTDLTWRKGAPLDIRNLAVTADAMRLTGAAQVKGLDSDLTLAGKIRAVVDDLSRASDLAGRPLNGQITADLSGEAALLTGAFDLALDAAGRDLGVGIAKLDSALAGQSTVKVSARRDQEGLALRHVNVTAPAGSFDINGTMTGRQQNFEFNGALDDLARFADDIHGPVAFDGEATRHDTGWLLDVEGTGPLRTTMRGLVTLPDEAQPFVKLDAVIGAINQLVPDLVGSADINATVRQVGDEFDIDAKVLGSAGSRANVKGKVRADVGRGDLKIDGSLPLGLLNRRLSPNALQGSAAFDLRLDGPLTLSSLNGQVQTSEARMSFPVLGNALTGIGATVNLSGGTAAIDADAGVATGGRITAKGQIAMQSPFSTNLEVGIRDAVIRDPDLFETVARGTLDVTGAIASNLMVAGRVNLDRTEIRVPSSGLGGSGGIPEIVHFNEPADVRRTRGYAGLLETDDAPGTGNGGGGSDIGLNVLIAADSRIFVRGRGLDAEMGGRFRLTGTTAHIIPIGSFNLIRGRLDILGKRLQLDEGSIRMQGEFIPYLRLVASRVSDDDTLLQVVVEGPADDPEISFVSEPSLPGDEVLARLLFGREIGSLSALQAVQLAAAVATLAGKGGTSVIERIRESTGLDDLNVGSDEQGGTTLGVGKYISDNIYTDVVIGDNNNSELNLNIDLSRRTKLRGKLESDGGSGIGIFFEKDY